MNSQDFLKIYTEDSFVQNLVLAQKTHPNLHLEGTSGSLDAVLAAAVFQKDPHTTLIIQSDKEDALYFFNDLQNIFGFESPNIAYFPASFKRPYEYEEIDNANVLLRSEILNQVLEAKSSSKVI